MTEDEAVKILVGSGKYVVINWRDGLTGIDGDLTIEQLEAVIVLQKTGKYFNICELQD